ncbi:gluconate 2-dehydrogenase subunit 3 family protein [Alphaproteobacteria bacterium]|nr:gluconate 2-dehydrogenase subunit 3 family protein [Alphaproteobacteria bacterium]
MNNFSLNRRAFLKSAGKASGFVVLAGGVVQLTSFNAWAAKKTSLDSHSAKTMLLVVKDMFPAKRFSDDLYMIAIDSLDAKAEKDESVKKTITDGVLAFDKKAGEKYIKASYKKRMAVLKSMEGQGFFNTMRGEMVNGFFNNKRVWDVAGWEGAAYDKGGYYLRGFQDADWPQPSKKASPKGWWE